MRRQIILVISLLLFSSFVFPIPAQKLQKGRSNKSKSTQKEDDKFRSPFRYAIIAGETKLEKYVNRLPEDSLYLQVLIEDKAFNENNLITLFKLLNERFGSTGYLGIEVYTTLDAIKTPEEQDHSNLYGPTDNYFDYKNAYFRRDTKGKQSFVYSIPNRISKKKVVIK